MINSIIYAIATEKSEYSCTEDEWFASFEEAMTNRMKYSNWFRQKGNVWIYKHEGSPRVSESFLIDETGKITDHYKY